MLQSSAQTRVDALIEQFWKNGFLTLSRKYGKYLPEPAPIGNYDVDAVGKYKKNIALGFALSAKDLENPEIVKKIEFITGFYKNKSSKKVTLFVGIPKESVGKARLLFNRLSEDLKKSIKLTVLPPERLN